MKKIIAILLLLLVVGCGESKQASESSPQQTPAPTLADSLEGKRIHFQIQDHDSEHTNKFWLQLGENNQLTVFDRNYHTLRCVITDNKLIVEEGGTINFNKAELATGDKVTFIEHNTSSSGIILKIEAAREIDDQRPQASQTIFPVTGTITYDGKPLADARIRLEAMGRGVSRVYACDSNANGTFEIEAVYSTYVGSGAPIGNYKVLVGKWEKLSAANDTDPDADEVAELELLEQQTEAGEDVIEAAAAKSQISGKFNHPSVTPLKLKVKEGKNSFRIDLKSDGTGTVKAL